MAVALLAYSNSFASGFIYDNRILLQDPRIHAVSAENLRLIATRDYWYSLTATGLYRPLATLSYLMNFAVLGDAAHPAGWHWINFGLHAVNLALVYALGLVLFEEAAPAFALAALWALHPVLTESVTNIIGRTDLLSALGVLAGLLCHARAGEAAPRQRFAWIGGVMVAAAVGIFSKESAVILPGLMALYDCTLRRRRSIAALAPSYVAVALPFVLFFYARSHALAGQPAMHIAFTDNPLVAAGFWSGRFTAVKVIGKYLWLLFFPLSLSCDYSYNQVPAVSLPFHTWEDWKALIALAACAAAAIGTILAWRRQRTVSFWIAFFFLTLAPTANIGILIGSIMAERFLYLPSIAFCGCVTAALFSWSRSRRQAIAAVACIAILFAVRTWARNSDWLDDASLWSSAAAVSPASYKAHLSLAAALADPAHLDAAIGEVERALAIIEPLPDSMQNPVAYIDAGMYYGQKGELLASRQADGRLVATAASTMWYRKSLDSLLRARNIEATNNEDERRRNPARGVAVKPARWYELYLDLGAVYLRLEQPRDALAALESGVRVRPVPEFFEKMSSAYNAMGDGHHAVLALLEGLSVDSSNAQFASALTSLYQQMDPNGCAIRNGSLNMECPQVRADVCAASLELAGIYRDAGMDDAARRTSQGAVRDLGCAAAQFSSMMN